MKAKIFINKIKGILGLSLQLAKADFKQRNEGSFLGILWYLLEPLFMLFMFLMVRNVVGQGIPNYPLYLFLGLIMFNFFRKTTSDSIKVITDNSGFIKSIKLNHEAFVVSALLKSVFSHFFEIIILLFLLVYSGISILNIVFYPLVFFFFCFFVLGISFFAATLGVYLKDFANLWRVFTRLLWLATPIFYASKLISKLNLPFDFNSLNPLYYFITIARECIAYNKVSQLSLIIGAVIFSLSFFVLGFIVFEKFKNKFSEMI